MKDKAHYDGPGYDDPDEHDHPEVGKSEAREQDMLAGARALRDDYDMASAALEMIKKLLIQAEHPPVREQLEEHREHLTRMREEARDLFEKEYGDRGYEPLGGPKSEDEEDIGEDDDVDDDDDNLKALILQRERLRLRQKQLELESLQLGVDYDTPFTERPDMRNIFRDACGTEPLVDDLPT